eukprot:CAMPEP_0174267194 /NCGR_PEP_ID=MMETSP0439-20130205/32778_1 /TAXON_ID=0 /ORGANISM="Stereomyxa ramosa, Strain Chinc5" /LENGTH=223 /DNA_ID=CAMNT_0015354555 /DNA_START=68 /DNA_END=739 /DNA_ORIENTATION=+
MAFSVVNKHRFLGDDIFYHEAPAGSVGSERCDRIIYIVRDPRDISVSSYYYGRTASDEVIDKNKITLEEYIYPNIVEEMTKMTDNYAKSKRDGALLLSYEALHEDVIGQLKKLSVLFRVTLNTTMLQKVADDSSFGSLRELEKKGQLRGNRGNSEITFQGLKVNVPKDEEQVQQSKVKTRKGEVGGYKTELSAKCIRAVTDLMRNYLHKDLVAIYVDGNAWPY